MKKIEGEDNKPAKKTKEPKIETVTEQVPVEDDGEIEITEEKEIVPVKDEDKEPVITVEKTRVKDEDKEPEITV